MKTKESIPSKYRPTFDLLCKFFVGRSLKPPTILRGPPGSGKSWLLRLVFEYMQEQADESSVYPIYLPIHLHAYQLVTHIEELIEREHARVVGSAKFNGKTNNIKIRFVIFIENVDRLFNLGSKSGDFARPKKVGPGITQYSQVQYASELRRFLIENSGRVTLLATSKSETPFTKDPDQPFFEFFNFLDLDGLNASESKEYLTTRLKLNREIYDAYKPLDSELKAFNTNWIQILTDGNIALLNALMDTIVFSVGFRDTTKLKDFLLSYFYRVAPYIEANFMNLSYNEGLILERAVDRGEVFRVSDLEISKLNVSAYLRAILTKGLISSHGDAGLSSYSITSTALRSYLRFFRNYDISVVLNPAKEVK